MFFLKKFVSRFVFPVPLCAGLLLLGVLLLTFSEKWKKLGRTLVIAGTALLLLCGYPWVSRLAIGRLEAPYRASAAGSRGAEMAGVKFIMVLGMGLSADTRRPAAARFSDEALQRILEGVRLHRSLTNSTLMVSIAGAAVSQPQKEQVLGELLEACGLTTNAVRVCGGAMDTDDEIAWCRSVVGTNRVVVVSSASHLPRAMLLAKKHGLDAIPSASGFMVDTVTERSWGGTSFFPGAANLQGLERAVNEYLGLAWEKLKSEKQRIETKTTR